MLVSYTHGFWFKVLDGEEVSKEQSADKCQVMLKCMVQFENGGWECTTRRTVTYALPLFWAAEGGPALRQRLGQPWGCFAK